MIRSRSLLLLVCALLLSALWPPPTAAAQSCTYRPNQAVDHELDGLTYNTIGASGFKYAPHLLNDRGYYLGEQATIPAGWSGGPGVQPTHGYARITDNRLRMYQATEPWPLPQQAVILIHGNSEMPDGWTETVGYGGQGSYLNHAGSLIQAQGYATYRLYITHPSKFQNARDRLARPSGGKGYDLDAMRVADLYEQVAPYYTRVHIAGISGGGTATVLGWKEVKRRQSTYQDRAGVVLSVEGYAPADGWTTLSAQHQDWSLFAWDWEGTAGGPTRAQFQADVADSHVYLAYGSCGASGWLPQLAGVAASKLIAYDGGHEFQVGVLWEAISRYGPLASSSTSCTPRPPVVVQAKPGGRAGVMDVTVTPGRGEVRSVEIKEAIGATVSPVRVENGMAAFTVSRTSGAATVRLVAVDGCGPWPSFVGGGPGAF